MYQEYYGLTEKPFNLTPDPRFLYLSRKHKEAFAHLMYGIQSRSGFVMVSGEIGTGKTTICRSLLKQLDPSIEVALIFNPYLSPEELLKHINQDFGIESDTTSLLGLIAELNEYLLKSAIEGKTCVLIIDEAQNLSAEILEQIRLLSNLETEKEKLIQIMLIGQPELAEKLELHELRQLNQRITARYHLEALTEDETLHYIAFRLRVAGGRKMVRFTRKAIREVYKISQGTPRVINAICDRALLIAFTMDTRELTPKIIKAAAHEIQGDGHVQRRKLNLMPMLKTAGVFSLAAVIVLAIILISSGPIHFGANNSIATPAPTVEEPKTERFQGSEQQVDAITTDNTVDTPETSERPNMESPEATAPPIPESKETEVAPKPAPPAEVKTAIAKTKVKEKQPVKETIPETPEVAALAETPEVVQPEEPIKVAKAPSEPTPSPLPKEVKETLEKKPLTFPKTNNNLVALNHTLQTMLNTWNVKPKLDKPKGSLISEVQAYGRTHGFNVSILKSPTEKLVNINLPMLLQVNSDQGLVWVAWLKGTQTNATLRMHDGTTTTRSHADLKKVYTNRALIFWRDSFNYKSPLRAHEQGEPVWIIQEHLAKLGLRDKEANGIFDKETVKAIEQLQTLSGLTVDGVLGAQTRMVLSSWIDQEKFPHLMDTHPIVKSTPTALTKAPKQSQVTAPPDPVTEEAIQAEDADDADEETYTPLIVETPEAAPSTITEPARILVPLRPITQEDDETEGAQEKE